MQPMSHRTVPGPTPTPTPARTPTSTPTARRGIARGPGAEVSPAELARELVTLLSFLLRESGQRFYALVEELGLSLTQIKTLHMLERSADELSVKELAERLGLSLPAASRNVEGMLQRGYLERREDESDRRIKRVRISELGREVASELHSERLTGLEAFARTLSERQRRRLSGALASLLEREEIAACGPCERS